MEIHRPRLLPMHVLADEGERFPGHPLHLVERGEDLCLRFRVLDELGVQQQARDRVCRSCETAASIAVRSRM